MTFKKNSSLCHNSKNMVFKFALQKGSVAVESPKMCTVLKKP